jgi:hypothetical protein
VSFMQALALTRTRATRSVVEASQFARATELDRAYAELRVELEQARLKIAEVEDCQSSLRLSYVRLENECKSLHNVAETLEQNLRLRKLTKLRSLNFAPNFKIIMCITRSFTVFISIWKKR